MIEIIKELKIEVSKPNIFQAVVAKQYDMNTRFIKATLVDGSDVIYIPSGPTIKAIINANRPDGQSKGFDGGVNDDGTVTVPLHSWMLEMEGTVICDISIIDTDADDNKKLTTTAFTLLVEKASYGGNDITNDPQYDVLVSMLETCQEASAIAEEALDKSNEANSKYDACVEATENANQAAQNANGVRAEIEAGGFIESLKEQNVGEKFTVWVGTQAEYDAIATKDSNCLYIIEDKISSDEGIEDIVKDYINSLVMADEKYPDCFYRKVDGSDMKEWLNPPMEDGVEYRTTERFLGKPVYIKSVKIFIKSEYEWPPVSVGPHDVISYSGIFYTPELALVMSTTNQGEDPALFWDSGFCLWIPESLDDEDSFMVLTFKYTKEGV